MTGLRTEVRELTPAEAERVRVLRDEAYARRLPALNVLPGLVFASISAVIVWFLSQAWWLSVLVFVLVFALGILESVITRRQVAHLPTVYDPRDATWKIREIEFESTALVTAMDLSESYTTWAIFRVAEDALVAEDLRNFVEPGHDHVELDSIAHQNVSLKQLWPYGPCLEVRSDGPEIPRLEIDFEHFLWEVDDSIDVEDDLCVMLSMDEAPEVIRAAFQELE